MNLKKLKTDDKLKYILECQNEGLDPKAISDNMGYSKLKNLDDFMKNRGYKRQDNRYILKGDICRINDIQISSKAKDGNYIPNIRQATEQQEKLDNIINSHTEIFEMLEWFREVKAKYPTIDIPVNFNIDYNKSNIIKTTVRVDENIWNDFSDICKNKYSHLSKVDILSQILKNFIDENK